MKSIHRRLIALVAAALIAGASTPAAAQFNLLQGSGENPLSRMMKSHKEYKKAKNMGEAEEIEVGQAMSAHLLGATPLIENKRLLNYVNSLGQWLALHTERPELQWHFGVLDTEDVNAFAAPGGYIFVTLGLILMLENEAELAGVLAHEMVHVLEKHHIEAIKKKASTEMATNAAAIVVGSSTDSMFGDLVLDRAVSAGNELFSKGLDKKDEYEADLAGVVIAARSGYDPYALASVLQKLSTINPGDGAVALMFKTHPKPDDRLERLMQVIDEGLEDYTDLAQHADRFAQVLTGG